MAEATGAGRWAVTAGARLITTQGAARADEIDGAATVWTSEGWLPALVYACEDTSPLYRVTLSDGSAVEVSGDAVWPVVSGEPSPPPSRRARPLTQISRSHTASTASLLAAPWKNRTVAELKIGERLCACTPIGNLPDAKGAGNLPEAGSEVDITEAYQLGGSAARRAARRPEGLGGLMSANFTVAAIRAFVDGWSDAQQGCLFGSEAAMRDLQILLRYAGVGRTQLEHTNSRVSLYIDSRLAWDAPPDSLPRLWTRRLHATHQSVVEVERLKRRGRVFVIVTNTTNEKTCLAVNNTMQAAAPAGSVAPATPVSASAYGSSSGSSTKGSPPASPSGYCPV